MPFSLLADAGSEPISKVYEVVIEGAPVMLWLGDETGKCVFLNRRQREFWGVTVAEVPNFDWSATLHPDDVETLSEPFREAMTRHTPMETEARFRRAGDGVYRTLRTSAEPRFDSAGRFVGMVGVNIDVTEQRQAEDDLRRARDAIALATRSSQLGWVSWNYRTSETELDQRAREILRVPNCEELTRDWMARLPAEDRINLEAEIRASAAEERPFNVIYRMIPAPGEERRIQASGMVETGPDGTPVAGTGLVRDVTDQWREEEFQRLLVGELSHRNKNLMSVVTALVKQTATAGRDAKEFQASIIGRLQALAAGMEITGGSDRDVVDVRQLAETVLAPYRQDIPDRIVLEGPAVEITSGFSRSLGLALHELATNAVKYGALSVAQGTVTVTWQRRCDADGARFALTWRERGGPPPAASTGGFGTRLLRDIVALETGGDARFQLTSSGLDYELSFAV